jgi:predicted secreted protein
MPFDWPLALAIYLTIWWLSLFLVLPFGVRTPEEVGEELPEGADRGAPAAPRLVRTAAITTAVAAVIFGAVAVMAKLM